MIAGVILAAGRSSRLGRPKQLLPLHGEPLIRHTVRRVLASSLDEVLVVVGHEAEAVIAALADLNARIVLNCDAALGQSTSVRAGIEALSADVEAAVFLLGDQPGVDPRVIDTLANTWRETEALAVAPRYANGLGNPVLFDRRAFPELALLRGDTGAKPVVRAFQASGELRVVPFAQAAPQDVDTEEDYATLVDAFLPGCEPGATGASMIAGAQSGDPDIGGGPSPGHCGGNDSTDIPTPGSDDQLTSPGPDITI